MSEASGRGLASGGFHILVVGTAHVAVLVELHQRCFSPGWSAEMFVSSLTGPGSFALLACRGEAADPVGFLLARASAGEAEILSIGVLPEYRRSGAGRLLVVGCTTRASTVGAEAVFLEVAESNASAQELYRSTGFRQVGSRKHYYRGTDGSTEDALIMRRDLRA